jgi:hypothetical protein
VSAKSLTPGMVGTTNATTAPNVYGINTSNSAAAVRSNNSGELLPAG